jgi:hypothetical protein
LIKNEVSLIQKYWSKIWKPIVIPASVHVFGREQKTVFLKCRLPCVSEPNDYLNHSIHSETNMMWNFIRSICCGASDNDTTHKALDQKQIEEPDSSIVDDHDGF